MFRIFPISLLILIACVSAGFRRRVFEAFEVFGAGEAMFYAVFIGLAVVIGVKVAAAAIMFVLALIFGYWVV